jgi:hypothetical protein
MEITQYLTNCVKNNIPVSFSKYGDGEFYCASGQSGNNCDNDNYTAKKRQAIIDSFIYMIHEAKNTYIGVWHNESNKTFWESLVSKPISWCRYHTIIFDTHFDNDKVELYKAIKYSNLNKLIVCNELLVKSKKLLNIDHIVHVPFDNWFDTQFESYVDSISTIIQNDGRQPLIITCCGMSAKVLICELYKKFPNGIFLDFGSALDYLCTKRDSRGGLYTYNNLINLLRDILPDDWDSEIYNNIYEKARTKMGIHL